MLFRLGNEFIQYIFTNMIKQKKAHFHFCAQGIIIMISVIWHMLFADVIYSELSFKLFSQPDHNYKLSNEGFLCKPIVSIIFWFGKKINFQNELEV